MNHDEAWNRRPKPSKIKEQTETYDAFERYEIIHGVRYDFQASPSIVHQILVTELYHAVRTTCHPEGIIVVAPMDVHLDENNTVQPDVIFIRNESLHIVKNQRIEGTPELLVEILSPSTGKHDRIRKKALYEAFRVQEYWIVDPVHYTIEQYALVDGLLHLRAIYGEDNHINSDLLTCVNIDVGRLFEPARRFAD